MKIIEKRLLTGGELREVCVRHHYYTNGTNEEYCALLKKVGYSAVVTTELLYELATDIHAHSEFFNCFQSDNDAIEHTMYCIAQACTAIFDIVEE